MSGTASRRPVSSSRSRRSRHLCAPSPPGSTRRARAPPDRSRSRAVVGASTSTVECRRSGDDAQALQRRAGGRGQHARLQVVGQRGAVQRLHAALQPRQVGAQVDGRAAAHQDRLEHAERRVGAVGPAREGGHRATRASRAAPRSAGRPQPRSPGAPSRSTPPARPPRPSRPRCRRPRRSRSARRSSRTSGSRRSARARRPGSRSRSRRCTPRARRPRARRSRASPGSSARRSPSRAGTRRAGGRESPASARSRPRTVDTRCHTPGACRGSFSAVTSIEPYSQTRPRSLRIRSTIITFSARSFSGRGERRPRGVGRAQPGGARRGSLDRLGHHLAAAAAQEELRREAAHGAPRPRDHARVARRRASRPSVRTGRAGRPARRPRAAGRGSPGRSRRRRCARGTRRSRSRARRRRAAPAGSCPTHTGRSRTPSASRARSSSRRALSSSARSSVHSASNHHRPVGVEVQEVVVEGEREVGQRHAPRRRRRDALEASAEVVAEIAEPAAADSLVPTRRPPAGRRAGRTGRRPDPRPRAARTRPALRRPPNPPRARTDARRRARAARPLRPKAFPRAAMRTRRAVPGTSSLSLPRPPRGTRSRRLRRAAARDGG